MTKATFESVGQTIIKLVKRATILAIGVAIGFVVARTWPGRDDAGHSTQVSPKAYEVEVPAQSGPPPDFAEHRVASLPTDPGKQAPETAPLEPDPQMAPRTPPVYVAMVGPSRETVSFEDLHVTFSRELRHEAWAFEVEAEIAQDIVDKKIAEWAVVEHVECRSMTCEVAGYLLEGSEAHPRTIVEDIDPTVWWHDERHVSTMRASPDGLSRS